MSELAALEGSLGITFRDRRLAELALVHTSYLNENLSSGSRSNERLEFLGDAVLGLVIAEKLYRDFPGLDEGEMTRRRSVLVRRESLAAVATRIGLGDHLYLGKGEEATGGRTKPANLAAALEAVIAAVYLDRGLAAARRAILKLFEMELERAGSGEDIDDSKSILQERSQASWQLTPVYRLIEARGPDHNRTFTVEVAVGARVLGRSSGRSKRAAETDAARRALEETVFTP